jgi:hypothetical protein
MLTLEYIKTAFIFVGAVIILVALGRSITVTMRRISLREKARKIFEPEYESKISGSELKAESGPGGPVAIDYNSKEVIEFLSQVTIEDICYDRYLRAAVDEMTGQDTIPPSPITIQPEYIPRNPGGTELTSA